MPVPVAAASMNVRWRRLSGELDDEEYRHWLAVYRTTPPTQVATFMGIDSEPSAEDQARATAPAKVTAEEASGSLEDARALVAQGQLRLRDLINTGDGWTTVEDCPALLDETAALVRAAQRWDLAKRGVVVALALAGLAALVAWAAR